MNQKNKSYSGLCWIQCGLITISPNCSHDFYLYCYLMVFFLSIYFISLNKQFFLYNKIFQITNLMLYWSSLALPWHHSWLAVSTNWLLDWLMRDSGGYLDIRVWEEREVFLPVLPLLKRPFSKTTPPAR